ncbi:MAG: hypothetical protein LBJ69_00455 [Holosporales bacterium]|nr:hypothetical protein [Holosporales bacterium]
MRESLAASFQEIVANFAIRQLSKACQMTEPHPVIVVLSGGVAASTMLSEKAASIAEQLNIPSNRATQR